MNEIVVGDVVVIEKFTREEFVGCLAIVEELHTWGVQAYIPAPGPISAEYRVFAVRHENGERGAWGIYVRLKWDDITMVGHIMPSLKGARSAKSS